MVKILHSSELYSHPNRLLEDHLIGTAKLAELFLAEKPIEIKDRLNGIVKVIALSHDIGKATKFFQKYLKAENEEKERLKNQKETRHSLLSAVCAYYLTKHVTGDKIFPVFSFLTIKRHHGDLRDVRDDILFDESDIKLLNIQLEYIDDESFLILCSKLYDQGLPLLLNREIISQWIDGFAMESNQIKRMTRKINGSVSNYIMLNLIYSILLDADKSDVVIRDISVFERNVFISSRLVDNYKLQTSFKNSPINHLREKAYQEITGSNIGLDGKIYSINLPTGLGKTLTSLSFALKLRKQIGQNHRIIYALPFLSIIEQNSVVFESVLKINGIEPSSNILLKHHHLSEIFYKKDDNEFESDEARILVEGWNAEIIITTFIQLFHSLISNQKKSIRKFHRFANSIIILDEVQSIPIKYWSLLKNVLMQISRMLNTYIILVTATEPLIFEKDDVTGLGDRDFYFKSIDRIVMKPLLYNDLTIAELATHFNLKDKRSYLFIFNTITATKSFYNLIKEDKIPSTYLSTHLTPKERLKRIEEIKNGKYKVVVSTQLVEAGVDIDFDVVIRDLAPLDSINQSAGRCNRSGIKRGEVYIVSLKDDKGRRYCSYIYDPVLIDITLKILRGRKEIKESDFLALTEEYYSETEKKKSQDISKVLVEAITKLRYDSEDDRASISDFQLIEEDYPKIDVFIELDEDAKKIWQQYLALKDVKDLFERKKLFDLLKSNFYQYVISIPANIENMPPLFGEIGYVEQPILEDYYDKETGFRTKEDKTVIIW